MDYYSTVVLCVFVVCVSKIAFKITIEKVDIFHKFSIEKIYVVFSSNTDRTIYRVVATPFKVCKTVYSYKLPFVEDL